jgi:hypothetical protein
MIEHVTQWLEAFHDGELPPRRAQQVEQHLETCTSCRYELDQLRSLSVLLAESPLPANLIQPETFVAQVGLRLPRIAEPPVWQQALKKGWKWAPVGILGSWAFLQAAFIATAILGWVLPLMPINAQVAEVLSGETSLLGGMTALPGADLTEIGRFGLEFVRVGGPLGLATSLNLGLTILIGLLFLSWLASWWVQQSNGNRNPSTTTQRMVRSKS